MNATKKRGITAILIAACVVIALLACATGVFAKNIPDRDTDAPIEAETPIESIPITVINTAEAAEAIDIPAEPIPEPADVPVEPVTNAEPADPEPINEQETTSVSDNVTEIETIPEPTACSYCGSAEHSASHCVKKSIEQRGASGRFRIPSLGVDGALFATTQADVDSGYAQALNDMKDSGVYHKLSNGAFFTDHASQGFRTIKLCKIGTKVYLGRGSFVETYEVTRILPSVTYAYEVDGFVCMYTCNNSTGTDTYDVHLTRVN